MIELRKLFRDICNGYSSFEYNSNSLYVKHLGHGDQLYLEELQEKYSQEALEKGLYNEKSRLEYLKQEGLWSDRQDRAILDQQTFLNGLITGRANIRLPSVLKRIESQINDEEKKLVALLKEKRDLIGLTTERYAEKLVNDYYIRSSIFCDKEFSKLFLNDEKFEDMEDEEVRDIFDEYYKIFNNFSEFNINKLAIQDFYEFREEG